MIDQFLTSAYLWMDAILIAPFRLPGDPLFGFLVGAFCLAMHCVIAGELTLSAAIRFNRGHLQQLKSDIARREALSIMAHDAGDRAGYKAFNKQANDAWGRHFFTMAAYSAGMLWPVPFALGWLNGRFHDVDFAVAWPLSILVGPTVGYPFIFIPLYILGRIVFGHLRRWLPYFRNVQKMLDAAGGPG
ncbi:hypothetical protein [Desulfatitalea tepidiphila]|uniref:hypothetical protein n=1 Tax=Desulfatitalea tepidiphila TaxID=1185843 RepID=UPI0009782D05|nr:hypothetical protein [Desulfatitalea tepidiphila]